MNHVMASRAHMESTFEVGLNPFDNRQSMGFSRTLVMRLAVRSFGEVEIMVQREG